MLVNCVHHSCHVYIWQLYSRRCLLAVYVYFVTRGAFRTFFYENLAFMAYWFSRNGWMCE